MVVLELSTAYKIYQKIFQKNLLKNLPKNPSKNLSKKYVKKSVQIYEFAKIQVKKHCGFSRFFQTKPAEFHADSGKPNFMKIC